MPPPWASSPISKHDPKLRLCVCWRTVFVHKRNNFGLPDLAQFTFNCFYL